MILSLLKGWSSKQVDFIMAYPQAPIEFDMYMELPHGIRTKFGDGKTHVLKLKKNLYGQKQTGRVWNEYLGKGLREIGFKQSRVDPCIFYRDNLLFFFYVDDGVFVGSTEDEIKTAVKQLQKNFDLEYQGDLSDYLGVNFQPLTGGRIKISQPHLIQQIIEEVGISNRMVGKPTPAASTKILRRNEGAQLFDGKQFHYRRVVGKLNFLEKSTRPDIAYAVHQCARFSIEPEQSHAEAIIHLARYLRDTKDEGIILDPNKDKSFEVFADADFAGLWDKESAGEDVSTAKSRSGYILTFAGCPVLWASKLQTQIALSTTEAEYIALSQSLRETIPVMELLKELKREGFSTYSSSPTVYCKAFEDNSGALELARTPKMRPRTKQINLVYHHFREYVRRKEIIIHPIGTDDQLADIFTKPLGQNIFTKHRYSILKWKSPIVRAPSTK